MSISALTKNNEAEEKVVYKQEKHLNEVFTAIELINAWKKYANSLTEEHHLKNTMLNCLPELQNNFQFEIIVNNPVQEQRLLDSSASIIHALQKELNNTQIGMQVRVSVDNEKKLGFTSLEKYNLMVEQNESLKRLKDEFGLELL